MATVEDLSRKLKSTIVQTTVKPVSSISSYLGGQRRPRDPWMNHWVNQEDPCDPSSMAEDNYRAVVARAKRMDIEVD